jgi:hypothetical protein
MRTPLVPRNATLPPLSITGGFSRLKVPELAGTVVDVSAILPKYAGTCPFPRFLESSEKSLRLIKPLPSKSPCARPPGRLKFRSRIWKSAKSVSPSRLASPTTACDTGVPRTLGAASV